MNKKEKNIELKIYELLGIKIFKKMVFKFRDILDWPRMKIGKVSKEKQHEMLYETPNNYIMKKGNGVKDLKDFKIQLLINASIHTCVLAVFTPNFLKIIGGTASLTNAIFDLSCIAVNIYCIMLQRYNHLRINHVIKKMEKRQEPKKSKLKDELIKEDSLLSEHTYKIVNKRDKEKDITLEELLENATYEELKKYRDYLAYFKELTLMREEQQSFYTLEETSISVPFEKNKKLKLELKPKNKKSDE